MADSSNSLPDGLDPVEGHALLFRHSRDAVLFTDGDGRIAEWNPAAEKLWGWSREEVLGRRATFLHPEGEGEAVVARILAALEADGRWEGVLETRTRSGQPRYSEVRVIPIFSPDGSLAATVGLNRDITRQWKAEEALLETAEGFRLLGDQLPHIVWVTDPAGSTQFINREWERITGESTLSALGSGWESVLHPNDLERTRAAWARSLGTGDTFSCEHRLRTEEGSYRWYLSRSAPIRAPDGRIRRWLGSTSDVHERKSAEQALRRRERYFRSMFESAHDAIVLVDEETGDLVDANPAAEALYGYERGEILRLSFSDLFPADHHPPAAADLPRAGGQAVTQRTRSGSELHVEMNTGLLEHEGRRVVLVINRDRTERRQLEQQLFQARKMEALGRLAGGLAHDFNNLTTAIQGFARILADQLPESAEAQEPLREIERASSRATALTRQLLTYTRQQVMRGQVLDLNQLVRSSLRLIERLIPEDVEIRTRLADALDPVRADPGKLNQVLVNLAVNARDAMAGSAGVLTVETRNVLLDREFTDRHPPMEPGPYVRLSLSDTGAGMPEEVREHAFEPFFTTKPVGEGTGLGLPMVYGIVKQSGGFVFIDSSEGEGARFDIFLPPVDAPVEPLPDPGPPSRGGEEPERAEGRTVLVVEDEEAVRKLARRVLERAGFVVLEAADGAEALERVTAGRQQIDLVLTDMVMPRMSGKELARQLDLTRPAPRVLYMSGYTGESLAERGDLTRSDVILEKPFRPAELVEAVRRRLED